MAFESPEYRILSFRYFYFIKVLQQFDYCKFLIDSDKRVKFAYRTSFPSAYLNNCAVASADNKPNELTYIRFLTLERNLDGTANMSFNHYINLFNKFSIWTSRYSMSLSNISEADYSHLKTYLISNSVSR